MHQEAVGDGGGADSVSVPKESVSLDDLVPPASLSGNVSEDNSTDQDAADWASDDDMDWDSMPRVAHKQLSVLEQLRDEMKANTEAVKLAAESSERWAQAMDRYTEWLLVLTIILLGLGAIQLYIVGAAA